MRFERIESLSCQGLMDLLPGYLNQIEPGLKILAEKLSLSKEEEPFMLVLKTGEKRVGLIEILDNETEFPGKVLSHAGWVAKNRMAISGLKTEPVDFDLLPFVICLVRSVPEWLSLREYLKIDLSLVKYQPLSFQGSTVLLLEPLGGTARNIQRSVSPISPPQEEKTLPRFTAPEAVNEMGLTEAEVRYFTT